ncbi:hypothetical protein C815_00488 [Firmicutes bacterium M10-2]|nr:hypothetical protein C815_00488 [Firmicutes bacterium M10-2]
MKKIIVRADDLGYSKGVNLGIEESVRNGIIRSIGFMTNMPESKNGYDLIKDLDVCLGQHTNICVGKPLSDPKDIPSLVDENGEFKNSKTYRSATEDFVNLDEVILEIEAQYGKFKEITGKEPAYFEGHAVASDNFFKGLEIVAQRHGLDYLGMSFTGKVPFRNEEVLMCMDSMDKEYDPIAFLKQIVEADYEDHTIPVMVCHPGYLDAYILKTSSLLEPRTLEVDMATSPEVRQWLKEHDVELITYDDLK